MYFPIFIWYIYISHIKTNEGSILTNDAIINVIKNLIITDNIYLFVSCYYEFSEFSLLNIILMLIAQDIYFYTMHKVFHNKYMYNSFHHIHHQSLQPFYAWRAHIVEHIVVNIGSIAIPFFLFPNNSYVLTLIVLVQVYTSVNGHTGLTDHAKHHIDHNKCLGSIYIMDRLLFTY